MVKALETAIERVKALSVERQQLAAEALEEILDTQSAIYTLTDEERRLVREGLAELDRGEYASDGEVRAIFDKYRG